MYRIFLVGCFVILIFKPNFLIGQINFYHPGAKLSNRTLNALAVSYSLYYNEEKYKENHFHNLAMEKLKLGTNLQNEAEPKKLYEFLKNDLGLTVKPILFQKKEDVVGELFSNKILGIIVFNKVANKRYKPFFLKKLTEKRFAILDFPKLYKSKIPSELLDNFVGLSNFAITLYPSSSPSVQTTKDEEKQLQFWKIRSLNPIQVDKEKDKSYPKKIVRNSYEIIAKSEPRINQNKLVLNVKIHNKTEKPFLIKGVTGSCSCFDKFHGELIVSAKGFSNISVYFYRDKFNFTSGTFITLKMPNGDEILQVAPPKGRNIEKVVVFPKKIIHSKLQKENTFETYVHIHASHEILEKDLFFWDGKVALIPKDVKKLEEKNFWQGREFDVYRVKFSAESFKTYFDSKGKSKFFFTLRQDKDSQINHANMRYVWR